MIIDHFVNIDKYISDQFSLNDPVMQKVEMHIRTSGIGWQSVSANQGKFLEMIVKISKSERILEVGTFGGYSAIWLARGLTETGKLISLELVPKHAEVSKKSFEIAGMTDKIEIREGAATLSLNHLSNESAEPFDLIFIDADKPNYPAYLEAALKLSRSGTIILADNVIRHAKIDQPEIQEEKALAVREFNKLLSGDRLDTTVIQTVGVKEADGISMSIVK